jgi:hypothetical protein
MNSTAPGYSPGDRHRLDVTIRGSVIASGALARWKAPELAAYLAAIYAEFFEDRGGDRAATSAGTGKWWRQLAWFTNAQWHPLDRPLLPFSKSLLEDGLNALAAEGLITREKRTHDGGSSRLLKSCTQTGSTSWTR